MQYFGDIFQMSTERKCEVTVLPLSNVTGLKHVCFVCFFSLSFLWQEHSKMMSGQSIIVVIIIRFHSGVFTYLPALLLCQEACFSELGTAAPAPRPGNARRPINDKKKKKERRCL